MNKNHYTYMAQWTKGWVVDKAQQHAAKVHFNHMSLMDETLLTKKGEPTKVNIRYGVIEVDDMIRDLEHWETLLVSSFMMRPHEILIKGDSYDKIMEAQKHNLKSALAFGALTMDRQFESNLYETIVQIPHYDCKLTIFVLTLFEAIALSRVLDKEDEEDVVDENFEEF